MSRTLDASLGRIQGRVFACVFGGVALRWSAVILFVVGAAVLLARGAFDWTVREAALAFVLLIAAPIAGYVVARQRALSRDGAAAWLDVETGARGFVVTGNEIADERWSEQLEADLATSVVLPRARLARPALSATVGAVFAVAALFVSLPEKIIGPPVRIQEAAVERVREKLETLAEEVTLPPELAEELKQSLQRLEGEDALRNPESVFEAVDRAEKRLTEAAESAAEEAAAAAASLAAAAAEASLDPEGAQKELEKTMSALASSPLAKGLARGLDSSLGISSLELPAGMKLDAAQLKKLADGLREGLESKLGTLANAGLLKNGKLGKAGELAKLDEFQFNDHVCDETCAKKPGGT